MKAIDIAKWFILKTNSEMKQFENDEYEIYEPITHLKLQKLVYYAHGIYLVINNKELFKEKILAWEHGPVVSEVYDEFKKFGKNPLVIDVHNEDVSCIDKISRSSDILETLELTYSNFAGYTAWQLRNMTHEEGTPWSKTALNSIIDNELIREYFEREIVEI